jgi:hypothetical protein
MYHIPCPPLTFVDWRVVPCRWSLTHRRQTGKTNEFWAEYNDGSTSYYPLKIEPTAQTDTLVSK